MNNSRNNAEKLAKFGYKLLDPSARKEAIVYYNTEEWFIADANDRNKILEPKEYGASNEDLLKNIAENNPDYADFINSHISELSKAIDDATNFIARETADMERDRLIADMFVGGGYGEDTADARAGARIEELDGLQTETEQEQRQLENAKAAEAPYVTVKPFSNVDFAKIGLDSEKRYSIPEFNEALANADKLYTTDENNSFRVDTFTVTLHIGEKNYQYRPMLGAEYGTLSAIMDAVDLVNASNIAITTQEKELVAEIERNDQVTLILESESPEEEDEEMEM